MLKAEVAGIGFPTEGTPQGGIISPLLSNVVLNELDWWITSQWEEMKTHTHKAYHRKDNGKLDKGKLYTKLRKTNLKECYIVRYADDFKIFCRNRKDAEKMCIRDRCKTVGNKTPMQEYVKRLKPGHPARALLSISDVAPNRTKGSFYTSALTTLRLFTSKSIYSITHRSDRDISDLGRKKQALFFILPDEKTTYYPIASLMVSQLYELLVHQSDERGGRLKNRVNFIMEEFGNFTKINDLTRCV